MANNKKHWQELSPIIITIIILGFVFGFDDKKEVFNLSFWLQNFIQQIIFSLIFILIFIKITQWYSKKSGITTTFQIWNIKKLGFARSSTLKGKGIPLGIILPLLISFVSYGKGFFSAVLIPKYETTKASRLGKTFELASEGELGLISLIGPLSLTLIGIILTAIKTPEISSLSLIPFSIAFCTMLPISKLNGTLAFFYAPTVYIFSMILIIVTYYLTKFTSPIESIILAILFSFLVASTFYIKSFILTK